MATEPPRKIDPWGLGLGIMGGVLLGTGITFTILGFVGVFEEPTPPTVPPAPTLTAPPPTASPPTFGDDVSVASVAAAVAPSTVAIEVDSFLAAGSGSGVVFGSDGYIITNHHVIDGATEVAVIFGDGGKFSARVVGSDPVTDIAIGVANDLIADGVVAHALLGIQGETAAAEDSGAEFPVGVLVNIVTGGSAYEDAGGQVNDVIVAIDGYTVTSIDGLLSRLRRLRADQVVPIRMLRGDAEETLDVTLGRLDS